MISLNKVLLVGNLTRDPELRYTTQGTPVATLRIAVNNVYKDKAGQSQKDTCFINVIVWSQLAEICNQYLQKGRQILVEGMIQSRSWQGNDGQKRNTIEIRAARVQFMSGGQGAKTENQEVNLGAEPQETLSAEVESEQSFDNVAGS